MKIGIIGSGEVGRALGQGFVRRGDQVMLGTRNPALGRLDEWQKANGHNAQVGSFETCGKFGEILVLAASWAGLENAITLTGKSNFKEKIVIDATNPLGMEDGGPPFLVLGHSESGGEKVQEWLKHSFVVKAFNCVGASVMVAPNLPDGPPDMFFCGNDTAAKEVVKQIIIDFGWNCVDIGGIRSSRYLEPLAMLWIQYFLQSHSLRHAFKLLRDDKNEKAGT